MSTSHRVYSDLFGYANFNRQVAVTHSKNLIIDALREYFKNDTFYKYVSDGFGFPMSPNLTNLPPDVQENRTTRIFIGDIYRFDKRYYPSITVRHTSGRYFPISMNQDVTAKKYRMDLVIDGYGNRSYIKVPTHTIITGAWEQSFEIIITSESVPDREELVDVVSSMFMAVDRQQLYEAGLFIKTSSLGGEREEDWGNGKLYSQSITLDTFSEFRREIPIPSSSLIETIHFCFKYGLFTQNRFSTDIALINLDDEKKEPI